MEETTNMAHVMENSAGVAGSGVSVMLAVVAELLSASLGTASVTVIPLSSNSSNTAEKGLTPKVEALGEASWETVASLKYRFNSKKGAVRRHQAGK
jgi:hypothetical protein